MMAQATIFLLVLALNMIVSSTVPLDRPASNYEQSKTISFRCDVPSRLLQAIGDELYQKGMQEFYVNAPPKLGPHEDALWAGWPGWRGEAPSQDLKNKWSNARPSSLASCIRAKTLDGRLIISTAEEKSMRAAHGPNSSDLFIRISAPVFDRSRRHAMLLYVSNVHAEAYHLERTNHGWKVVGRNILWVS